MSRKKLKSETAPEKTAGSTTAPGLRSPKLARAEAELPQPREDKTDSPLNGLQRVKPFGHFRTDEKKKKVA